MVVVGQNGGRLEDDYQQRQGMKQAAQRGRGQFEGGDDGVDARVADLISVMIMKEGRWLYHDAALRHRAMPNYLPSHYLAGLQTEQFPPRRQDV